jgi:hypothetical protein
MIRGQAPRSVDDDDDAQTHTIPNDCASTRRRREAGAAQGRSKGSRRTRRPTGQRSAALPGREPSRAARRGAASGFGRLCFQDAQGRARPAAAEGGRAGHGPRKQA